MSDKEFENKGKKPKLSGFKNRTERLRAGNQKHLKHGVSMKWRLDSNRVSEKFGDVVDYVSMEELEAILTDSRTGEALLEIKEEKKIDLYFDPQVAMSQYYPDQNVITLNPHRPKQEMVIMLAKELRRAWQYENDVLLNPLSFDPEEAILLNRSQQADTLIVAIRIAWELKLAGKNDIWNFMIASTAADVLRTYEIQASTDFRSLNNGTAARAAYDKWFEGERMKMHDKRIIHQMLLDDKLHTTADVKTDSVLSDDLLMKLGDLPFGKNYLSLNGYRMPTHEDYSAVEDRSNANFLWFIKFERSFQEKERQMAEETAVCSADIVDFSAKARELGNTNYSGRS